MGHHLTVDNHFQSDKPVRIRKPGDFGGKYAQKFEELRMEAIANGFDDPCSRMVLGEGLIPVSFNHPEAWAALALLAEGYSTRDPGLSDDIWTALKTAQREHAERQPLPSAAPTG